MRRARTLTLLAVVCLAAIYPTTGFASTDPAAEAELVCIAGQATATFSYTGFSPKNHLTATARLTVTGGMARGATWTFDGPGSYHSLTVPLPKGAGPFTVTTSTQVVAGGGRVKASAEATVRCRNTTPPPPDRAKYDPRAWAQGPCADPMYRFWLDNTRSNREVTFRVRYLNFDTGWTTLTQTVPKRAKVKTRYHHVTGFSLITIRARGETLYSRHAAAPGNYRACWL